MAKHESVVVERTVSVPPAKVWPYLTSGSMWSKWQGESAEIDPVPGGRFTMRMPDGAVASGDVVEIVEHRSITITWGWEGAPFDLPPGSTTVSIALLPLDNGGTRITITHGDLPAELAEPHRDGWTGSLSNLSAVLPERSTDGGKTK